MEIQVIGAQLSALQRHYQTIQRDLVLVFIDYLIKVWEYN